MTLKSLILLVYACGWILSMPKIIKDEWGAVIECITWPCRMRYCSTRADVKGRSFRDVLFSGYAPDGGMFMPESVPSLSAETLRLWRRLSYQQLLCEICCLYIPEQEIPRDHLQGETPSLPTLTNQVQLIKHRKNNSRRPLCCTNKVK